MSRPATDRIDPDELVALEEQRGFLLASLEDLDREHDAGDLDDDDYATLHDDYTKRAARVLREIDDTQRLIDRAAPEHPMWRRLIALVAIVVVAVVAGIVVTSTSGSGSRSPSPTNGERKPSKATQACIDKMGAMFAGSNGQSSTSDFGSKAIATIQCFTDRIVDDPKDAVAYTYRGRVLGLLAQQLQGVATTADVESFQKRAMSDLATARRLAPDYPDALAFSAMSALSRGDTVDARKWLDAIDRLQLPASNPVLPIVNNVLRPALRSQESPTSTGVAGSTTSPAGESPTSTTLPSPGK